MSTTTTDNHPKAPTALSRSPSASSFDFSKPFTLVSADGHSFSVDPLKLAGTSSVFADMLSSGGGDRTCTLSEKKEEIEVYLEAVEKGTCLGVPYQATSLHRMADKYDSALVRAVLARRGWVELDLDNHQYIYAAGRLLGDQAMARSGASASLSCEVEESNFSRRCISSVAIPVSTCLHPAIADTVTSIWTLATHRATVRLKPSDEPDKVIREELYKIRNCRPSCLTCINLLDEAAHKVGENWASPNKGKKSVKLFD